MHSFELRKKLPRNKREDHYVILEKRIFCSIIHIIIFNSKNYKAQDMSGFHLQNIESYHRPGHQQCWDKQMLMQVVCYIFHGTTYAKAFYKIFDEQT